MSTDSEQSDQRPVVIFVLQRKVLCKRYQKRLLSRFSQRWRMAFYCDLEEAHLAIAADKPGVIVVDENLRGSSGLAFSEETRRRQRGPLKAHCILLTEPVWDRDLVFDSVATVQDYVGKPVKVHELTTRIDQGVRLSMQRRALMRAEAKLRMESMNDPLTGVSSRHRVAGYLRQELARVRRGMGGCGLAMFDIDRFHEINQKYGEEQGDTVLIDVAKIIKNAGRQYDMVARWSGDTFVVVLPGTDNVGAMAATKRLVHGLSMLKWQTAKGRFGVTASVGLVVLPAGADVHADQALQWLVDAAASAKRSGRDQLNVMEPLGLIAA